MPVLKRFGSIRVAMFPNDHPPPHVHILFDGQDMAVNIVTGRTMVGSLRNVEPAMDWIHENRDTLMTLWNGFNERRS